MLPAKTSFTNTTDNNRENHYFNVLPTHICATKQPHFAIYSHKEYTFKRKITSFGGLQRRGIFNFEIFSSILLLSPAGERFQDIFGFFLGCARARSRKKNDFLLKITFHESLEP